MNNVIKKKNNESWFWFEKLEILNNELWIINSQQELVMYIWKKLPKNNE